MRGLQVRPWADFKWSTLTAIASTTTIAYIAKYAPLPNHYWDTTCCRYEPTTSTMNTNTSHEAGTIATMKFNNWKNPNEKQKYIRRFNSRNCTWSFFAQNWLGADMDPAQIVFQETNLALQDTLGWYYQTELTAEPIESITNASYEHQKRKTRLNIRRAKRNSLSN